MTVKQLIEILSVYPDDMDVVVSYNDPGSDGPLVLPITSGNIDEGTFWDWDENKVSDESLIIEI
jgi:hypothetical protein